eukprot:TRINITY_DN9493_c0_g1_i1.p1 TRINITY_DN9493_c0_g1~~TRINITY_DN9493_c0_g1_i1.p1  ORF type:complete len:294 (-),score=67.14 TRINITY_DN9493_c0_g1_i1:19-855(-)
MSSDDYENYDQTSSNYDLTRLPSGIEIVLGNLMRYGRVPLKDMNVLDAGCGTGNYSRELLKYVNHVHAVDISQGMIDTARAKLAKEEEEGKIEFVIAPVYELPFPDDYFDGIMVNQVLHHLADNSEFQLHERVFSEFRRVLKKGGVLTINTCSHEQLERGYWYYSFLDEEVEKLKTKYIPVDHLKDILSNVKLSPKQTVASLDDVLQGESYYNPKGILNRSWRDGDSIFALVTEEKLKSIEDKVKKMEQENSLEEYLVRTDTPRKSTGQYIVVTCVAE